MSVTFSVDRDGAKITLVRRTGDPAGPAAKQFTDLSIAEAIRLGHELMAAAMEAAAAKRTEERKSLPNLKESRDRHRAEATRLDREIARIESPAPEGNTDA